MGDKIKYVIQANEAVWMPKNSSSVLKFVKISVRVIVSIIVIASLLFHDNIFAEINWGGRLLMLALAASTFFTGGREKVPSEFEIRFYDDFFVLYREKRLYNFKTAKKEYNKFFYKDISQIEYRIETKRINIYGIYDATWFNYKKDGTLPEVPTFQKRIDSICYFYTDFAENIDFVALFESYCNVKVKINNN